MNARRRGTFLKALTFAAVYVALSLGVEALLIVVLRWRVPQDNGRIAPVILTVPPMLAAWLTGFRRRALFIAIVVLTVVLTVLITVGVNRLTGISVGLAEPLINRSLAGFIAAVLTIRFFARTSLTPRRPR